MLIFDYFLPKINCMVKMTTPYPSPYCALSSCKILGTNNKLFLRQLQRFAKKGKKGAKNADFSRTDKSTAKQMVVGCVQYYSTHSKKLGKQLELFFHKVQKTAKKGEKGKKGGPK